MPAAGHDDCHPQEVLGLTVLGGLCEIQLHGEAVRQGASWEWGVKPGDLCCAGESPAAGSGGRLDWFCLSKLPFRVVGLSFLPGLVAPCVLLVFQEDSGWVSEPGEVG